MTLWRRQPALPSSVRITSRHRLLRALPLSLCGVAVLCVRSCHPTDQRNDRDRYHDRTFRVARVIDGDTLDIDVADGTRATTRIRLWGVDCPEVGHHGKENMHFGPEATAFARKALEGRDVLVILSPKQTRGKYGRLLAYVYLKRGGPMFNEMLIEQGFAYADLRFKHHYYRAFKSIEKRARRDSMGLWADASLEKMPPWKQRFERPKTERGGKSDGG